jgi:hypothetical protein
MSKSDKPMRCTLDLRNIPIETYKHPSFGRNWKATAQKLRALLMELSSYANPDGTLGKFSPSMETLKEHHAERTLYRYMDFLSDLGFLTWDRRDHHNRRQYTILIPRGPNGGVKEHLPISKKHLPESLEHLPISSGSPANFEKTPARFAENTCQIRSNDSPHVPQNTEINEKVKAPPSITVLETVKPSVPPSVHSETVHNTDELREGMAKAFSKARPGEKLNWTEFADIENLAAECGNELLLKVWKRWLRTRDTNSLRFHLKMFRKEFDTTRADVERISRDEKAQKEQREKIIADDIAKTERENEAFRLKLAADDAERARIAKACRESGLPY